MRFVYFLLFVAVFVVSCSEESPNPKPTTDGLIAYYDFEGDASDKVGTNDGIITNIDYFSISKTNNEFASKFTGVDSYVDLIDPFDYENRTISLWILASEISDIAGIFYSSDNLNIQYGLTVLTVKNEGLIPHLYYNVSNKIFSTPIEENRWYHVAAIAEGMNCRYYLDGNLVYSASFDNYIKSGDGELSATIGCSRKFDRFYNGLIDDLRVYNRSLTEAEVKILAKP